MHKITTAYYQKSPWLYALAPLAWVFGGVSAVRRLAYKKQLFKSTKLPVPIIVVGNLTLGGTGKTPLVVWLAELLRQHGFKPGIVSRGYGGRAKRYPLIVEPSTPASMVGDEPLLIHQRTQCPVVVDPKRVRAAHTLLQQFDCNIILSDDGLQHYSLQRDIEIVVIDAGRLFGNGLLFPAGPLREPVKRLAKADFIISQGAAFPHAYTMQFVQSPVCYQVQDDRQTQPLAYFAAKTVHAVAGIGNPTRFFQSLRDLGLNIIEHAFPDHYYYQASDLAFGKEAIVIMTEKDAVKCRCLKGQKAPSPNLWYLPISAELEASFAKALLQRLEHHRI